MARAGSANSHSRHLRGNMSALIVRVEADGTGGITVKNGAARREIVGVKVVAKAASASGDVDVATAAGAVATVAMATDGALTEATSLTNTTVEPFGVVTVTSNGAADRGTVIIETVEL